MTKPTLTVVCHEDDRSDATHLGVTLGMFEGFRPEEWERAFAPQFRDANGQLYRAMSMPVTPNFVMRAVGMGPVERPPQDVGDGNGEDYIVNLTGARRAQAKLVIWTPTDPPQPIPQADPSRIVAVVGLSGVEALAAMGLQRVEVEGL